MKNIKICRCEGDEAKKYQGYIEPEDKTWRLFVDHEGIPHLLVAVTCEGEKPGDPDIKGMMSVETMMHNDMTIKALMLGKFGGHLTPEEEAAIIDEDFPPEHLDFGPGPHNF